jgi:hypothetical protein
MDDEERKLVANLGIEVLDQESDEPTTTVIYAREQECPSCGAALGES